MSSSSEEGPPDSHISSSVSLAYWNTITPDVSGMLGGYPQVSRIDLQGSKNFLSKIRRLRSTSSPNATTPSSSKLKRVVDCGAGIGRVTEGFLSQVADVVDIVEPVANFAKVIESSSLKAEGRIGDVYLTGLESWKPSNAYNLIWNQWCLGHLTDAQLVEYLKRCTAALTKDGWIAVKENLSTHSFGEDLYDELDSSVTRSDQKFRELFESAGLGILKTELQTGFPKGLGLYPVRMYALRPK